MNHKTISSRATKVTFYEDRARVTRTATVSVTAGSQTVLLDGVSVLVAADTLQAQIAAPDVKVTSISVRRVIETSDSLNHQEIATLESEVDEAMFELDGINRRIALAVSSHRRTKALESTLIEQVASARDGVEMADATLAGLDQDFASYPVARQSLLKEREQATKRLEQLRFALVAGRVKTPKISTTVEVQVEAEAEKSVEVELTYFVPSALWRPSHNAKLNRAGDDGTIEWEFIAVAWQRTGEIWDGVDASFSTARSSAPSTAPLLYDDVIQTRLKEDKTVHVEARDVEVSAAGVGADVDVSQMPGVDDGGEPIVLEGADKTSIPSSGRPVKCWLDSTHSVAPFKKLSHLK